MASENGLSDNERRYQGLLRKQRLELNYLLKERERLLQAQRQLSDLAGNESEEAATTTTKSSKKQGTTEKNYPKLTKAHIQKQQGKNKGDTMRRLFSNLNAGNGEEYYPGSEHEIYPAEQAPSNSKAPMAGNFFT